MSTDFTLYIPHETDLVKTDLPPSSRHSGIDSPRLRGQDVTKSQGKGAGEGEIMWP